MPTNPVLAELRKRRQAEAAVRRARARLAAEATRLRIEGRPWNEIARDLGYVTGSAAAAAARRYGGFDAGKVEAICEVCNQRIPRVGRTKLRRFCDEHRDERRRVAEAARRAAAAAALPPLRCVDCRASLERRPGRLPTRCTECGRRRRRERERARDRRRAAAKMAEARSVGYTTAHWKRVSRAAIARAGQCADCGRTDDLTGHLVNIELKGDHRKATIDDVEVLCRSCHGRLTAAA